MDKKDTESLNSPESLSELDQLKMELERDFFKELCKEEDKEDDDAEHDEEEFLMESSKEEDADNKSQEQEKTSKDKSVRGGKASKETSKHSHETRLQSKTGESKKTNKMIMHNMEKLWLAGPAERACLLRNEKGNNYVVTIKIFDRGLVVNDFSSETSMYTLCRAWMKNERTSVLTSQSIFAILAAASKRQDNGPEILEQLKSGRKNLVCSMPASPSSELETEQTTIIEKRVPDLTALENCLKATNNSTVGEVDDITSKKNLLSQHKLHWKKTKSNWIKNIRKNCKRHEVNLAIIELLFKPHLKISTCLFESDQAN